MPVASTPAPSKDKGHTMSPNTKAPEGHPGWLYVDPANRPVYWYRFDATLSYDEKSAFARFEPDADARAGKEHAGWTVRAGSVVALVPAAAAVRASA